MHLMRALSTFIFICFSGHQIHAQSCSVLFQAQNFFLDLSKKDSVTETEILRAAERDVLGDAGLTAGAKNWAREAFSIFNLRTNLQTKAEIEIWRRIYEIRLNTLQIPIKTDLKFLLSKYKPYLQAIFALGANGAVNYLTYHYLSTAGYIVYIPQLRIFNAREIPDEVLLELASTNQSEAAPKTKAYIFANIKYGAQKVFDSVRRVTYAGLISVFILSHAGLITDPTGHFYNKMDNTSMAINRMAYDDNQQTIRELEERKQSLEKSGQYSGADKLNERIAKLKVLSLKISNDMRG